MNRSDSILAKTVTRRRILGYGAAGAGLAMLPWQSVVADADGAPKADAQQMLTRAIPSSGEKLPVVGLGTSGAFSTTSAEERERLREVMSEFVAMGGTLVDTAPTYGNAEHNVAEIAEKTGVREDLFMATKVHARGQQAGIDQMAESARTLGEPIDLMQVHNVIDLDTQWRTLEQMKEAGDVRYTGITHYQVTAFDKLKHELVARRPDFAQFNYSIMTPDAERGLFPLVADHGIGVIVNRPFDDGLFFRKVKNKPLPDYAKEFDCTSWAQFALKYVLAEPLVNVVIPATGNPEHLRENMAAGCGKLPDRDLRQRMRKTLANL